MQQSVLITCHIIFQISLQCTDLHPAAFDADPTIAPCSYWPCRIFRFLPYFKIELFLYFWVVWVLSVFCMGIPSHTWDLQMFSLLWILSLFVWCLLRQSLLWYPPGLALNPWSWFLRLPSLGTVGVWHHPWLMFLMVSPEQNVLNILRWCG